MKTFSVIIFCFVAIAAHGQVLPVRQQAAVVNELLSERLNNLLPSLMEKTGIDMWVIVSREYNEDPIIKTSCRQNGCMQGEEPSSFSIIIPEKKFSRNWPSRGTMLAQK